MKPAIVVRQTDHLRLTRIANGLSMRNPELADDLLGELERARIVDDAAVPGETIQIGSTFSYRLDGGERRQLTLVYPEQADIEAGRVSILTPTGVAALGLSPGDSISFRSHDGRTLRLTVEAICAGVAQ